MAKRKTKNVIVAGAGIGGLAAALALAGHGFEVRVFEQAEALREVGAGIQLSPNAIKGLAVLGLSDSIARIGFEPTRAVIRHYQTGREYLRVPLGPVCQTRYGAPFLQVHRADLIEVLAKAVTDAGIELILGTEFDGYARSGDRVFLTGTPDHDPADILIGADGLRSAVRAQMMGSMEPRFTGQTAWRATVSSDRVPAGLVRDEATVWVGPGGHVVTYLLRGGSLINLVVVREKGTWRGQSWTEPGDPNDLRVALRDWHPDVRQLIDTVDQANIWALFDHPPLSHWSDGQVALLGDACHPTLPFLAQGAAMAIEDACVLAQCLARDTVPTAEALKTYEAARKPRTSMLQAKARSNAGLYHPKRGAAGLWTRSKLTVSGCFPPSVALRLVDPIYGYDPTRALGQT